MSVINKVISIFVLSFGLFNLTYAGQGCSEDSLLKETVVLRAVDAANKLIEVADKLSPTGDKVFFDWSYWSKFRGV